MSHTISDKIRAEFNFEVNKFPLSGPDRMYSPHYGLFRSDNNDPVGIAVKKNYNPHTVDDICALAEAAEEGFDAESEVRCYWKDGHYVTIRPSDAYRQSIYGTKDNVFPSLIIRAGYDGRAFRASLGLYRDLCSNLMMLRATDQTISANIQHSNLLHTKLDDLIPTFQNLVAEWNGVVDTAKNLDQKTLNLSSFLREVYPLPAEPSSRTLTTYESRIETIVRRISKERVEVGKTQIPETGIVSAWEAFNGIQGYTQHHTRRHGTHSSIDRAINALENTYVEKALKLALAA